MSAQGFNIFSAIFGDPMAQQNAITKRFNHSIIALNDAKMTRNKAAQRAALAEMKALAGQGSKEARAALRIANTPTKLAAMAKKAGSDLAKIGGNMAFYALGAGVLLTLVYGYAKK